MNEGRKECSFFVGISLAPSSPALGVYGMRMWKEISYLIKLLLSYLDASTPEESEGLIQGCLLDLEYH